MRAHDGWTSFLLSLVLAAGMLAAPKFAGAQDTAASQAADVSPAGELALWNGIKESNNSDDYLKYLNQFPNGMFFDPAKARYEQLSGQAFVPGPGLGQEPQVEPPKVMAPPPVKKKTVAVKSKNKPNKKIVKKSSRKTKTVSATKHKSKQSAAIRAKKPAVASNKKSCRSVKPGQTIVSYKNGCPVVAARKVVPVKTGADAFGRGGGGDKSGGGGGGGGGSGGGGGGWGG